MKQQSIIKMVGSCSDRAPLGAGKVVQRGGTGDDTFMPPSGCKIPNGTPVKCLKVVK